MAPERDAHIGPQCKWTAVTLPMSLSLLTAVWKLLCISPRIGPYSNWGKTLRMGQWKKCRILMLMALWWPKSGKELLNDSPEWTQYVHHTCASHRLSFPIEVSGVTKIVALCLIISIFRWHLPDAISHKHCCSIQPPILCQEPITHHVIYHRHLYIRWSPHMPWPKNYLHPHPTCQ